MTKPYIAPKQAKKRGNTILKPANIELIIADENSDVIDGNESFTDENLDVGDIDGNKNPDAGNASLVSTPKSKNYATIQKQSQFLQLFPELETVTATRKALNIRKGTLDTWLRDPKFAAKYEDARQELVDKLWGQMSDIAHGRLDYKANMPQVTALFGLLKSLDPERWNDKLVTEVVHRTNLHNLKASLAILKSELAIPPKSSGVEQAQLCEPDNVH